jgi:molybdopterin synthase sulfur carrier subunit
MRCIVRIPVPMRRLTDGQSAITAQGRTVSEVLSNLKGTYPDLGRRLFSPTGQIQQQVGVFLNNQDVLRSGGLETPLREGDVITVLPVDGKR